MNALTLVFVALCVFALAYRYYGLFIAKRVLELKEDRETPATRLADVSAFSSRRMTSTRIIHAWLRPA